MDDREDPQTPPPWDTAPPPPVPPPANVFPPPPVPPPSGTGAGIPWEERHRLGWLRALLETIKLSLFSPTAFFSRLPPTEPIPPPPLGGAGSALLYAILVGVPSLVIGLFWQLLASSMGVMFGETQEAILSLGTSLIFAAFSPLFIIIGVLVTSLVIHVFLLLFGGAHYGFVATFRTVCYASAPEILQVIPLCGGLASGIWCFVLWVIGLAAVHRTTMLRSFAAVTVPTVACCGFFLLALIMAGLAGFLGSWGSWGSWSP